VEVIVRFLQVHLSMQRGGAHSAVTYLKNGLLSLGHHCDISSDRPDRITSLDYDLVVFHSFSPDNAKPYADFLDTCRINGLPRVIVMHDYWPMCHQTNMVMSGRGLMQCRDDRCDVTRCGWSGARQPSILGIRDERIVCFTDRSADLFRRGGFQKISVIPHGIDTTLFSPIGADRNEVFDVFFTNAWGKKDIKGYRHWDWIRRNVPSGASCNEVVGGTRLEEMPMSYSSSDVTLFLSLWEETFGLTIVESLACGTPVISYPVGIAPDIIEDGVNGFLARDSNPRTVIDLISRMMEMDDDEMSEMRRNSRISVEDRFSSTAEARRYVELARSMRGTPR